MKNTFPNVDGKGFVPVPPIATDDVQTPGLVEKVIPSANNLMPHQNP
jgi:hypothetical protein